MSEISKQGRAPQSERAGTHLSNQAQPVMHNNRQIGMLDPETGVFQGGGEYSEIFYTLPTPPLMSMPLDVWQRLQANRVITRWEMIEHANNTVWVVDFDIAHVNARYYHTSGGQRVGIPKTVVRHLDAEGRIMQDSGTNPQGHRQLSFGDDLPVAPARKRKQ